MLVLSRNKGEKIIIDGKITITILEVAGGKVRIGFDAPRHISIHRQEIYDAIMLTGTIDNPKADDPSITRTDINSST